MTDSFHIPTTDRLAGHDAGMGAWKASAAAQTVNDESIAPVRRRAR